MCRHLWQSFIQAESKISQTTWAPPSQYLREIPSFPTFQFFSKSFILLDEQDSCHPMEGIQELCEPNKMLRKKLDYFGM